MPPKKPPAKGKEEKVDEDDTSVPCNDVNFKIQFDVKHEGGHYFKVKYDWFTPGPPSTDATPQVVDKNENDTGFLKDWNLIQIEGEEPVEAVVEDPKAKGGKKDAPKDKKGGAALEEITDNRPRIINFVKQFGTAEGGDGGPPTRVTADVAKFFEDFLLNVSIWEVNRETQEETFCEQYGLDMSQLLFETAKEKEFTWKFDKFQTIQICYLNISISTDNCLLNSFLRKKLNPLQVNLVACKDVPYKTDPQFKPVFSYFHFVDGRKFKTLEQPQQASCKFNHKHVFLLGDMDHILLREMLATSNVSVELHDCDEYIKNKEDAEAAIFSAGKAKFTFRDFLRKNVLELKLRSDVFPLKRDEVDNTQNLDLNTTARKGERGVDTGSPYLNSSTFSVIIANLARPIGPFNHDKELAEYKKQQKVLSGDVTENEPEAKEAEPTPEDEEKMRTIKSEMEESLKQPEKEEWNENDAIFERLVIIIPYKSPDMVKQIEDSYEKVNLKGLNLSNARYLSTKELSEEDRANRSLDFIGGFSLMDSETRMYIFEGLGGEGRGINEFYKENMRQKPNDRKYTLFYNPDVRFKNRIYLDFNVAIKKIKLRETLRSIMGSPDVYLRSKVPEDMFHILQQFAEIRKLTRLSLIRDFNLFPITEKLLTLERKYGDSLNIEDLTGKPGKPKKKKTGDDGAASQLTGDMTKTGAASAFSATDANQTQQTAGGSTAMNNTQQKADGDAMKIEEQRVSDKRKADTDCNNRNFELSLKERQGRDQINFKYKNVETLAGMGTGRPLQERLNIPDGVDVFQYGNQKLNIWEFQKEQLRQQISKDQTKFYTYSAEHLSLAFPIVNENEIEQKAKEDNERSWKTKSGFDNVMKRENWNLHPKKPDLATIQNLKIPHHEQALATKMHMKGFQFVPGANGKPDFQAKVKSQKPTFSNKEYFNTVFISGDDMVKELAEQKQKEIDDFNKKVVVASQHFQVNTREKAKVAQLDKYKNVREGEVVKVGLRHNKRRISAMVERQIMITKNVEDPPVSMLKEEQYMRQGYRPPYKVFDKSQSLAGRDMDTNIHPKMRENDTRSRKVFIQDLLPSETRGPKWGN